METNIPSWLPWVLIFIQFLIALLLLFMGTYLKDLKEDVKESSTKVEALKEQVLSKYTPLMAFNRVSTQVAEHETALARLKARDEVRWLQEGKVQKQ